jgi:hypothetical protein
MDAVPKAMIGFSDSTDSTDSDVYITGNVLFQHGCSQIRGSLIGPLFLFSVTFRRRKTMAQLHLVGDAEIVSVADLNFDNTTCLT